MPIRKTPLVNDHYYHIFNRGVNKQQIFTNRYDYKRMMDTIRYYKYQNRHLKFSSFLNLGSSLRSEVWKMMEKSKSYIDIIAFCLMPNHFHLLIKQNLDSGVSKFLSEIQNSYTRYFNLRHDRTGHLFQGQFKSVLIQSDEQLQHVSRYIHLNPYSSAIIKSLNDLEKYEWSSIDEYLSDKDYTLCNKNYLINTNMFKTRFDYNKFVHNNADYQKQLEGIKHLTFD